MARHSWRHTDFRVYMKLNFAENSICLGPSFPLARLSACGKGDKYAFELTQQTLPL